MMSAASRQWVMVGVLACAVSACDRAPQQPAAPAPAAVEAAPTVPAAPPPATAPEDVVETTSDYVLGISYPGDAGRYPGLLAELRRYADGARGELLAAVADRKAQPGAPMYDLTLGFTKVSDSPSIVVIAADGSTFTGGEQSRPLLARFVWLVKENRLLTAAELVPDAASWNTISGEVRRQLHMALAQRVDADGLAPVERKAVLQRAGALIDAGTQPKPDSFASYEPVLTRDGKIGALRFVFPPYQVGSYADGTQTVQLSADVLLPHIAPRYRPMFAGTTG